VTTERGVFDFLRARGEEFLGQVSNDLMSNPRFIRALQTAMRGKEWMDQAVAQALRTMNVPTRTEFKRALGRIEVLERELAEARRDAAAAAKAGRRTTTAGGRKKTAASRRKAAPRTRARKRRTAASTPAVAAVPVGEAPAK
jgi:hypothetical protein